MSGKRHRRSHHEDITPTETSIFFDLALANTEQLYEQLCQDLKTVYEVNVRCIRDLQTMLSQIVNGENQRTAVSCLRLLEQSSLLKPNRVDVEKVKSAVAAAFAFVRNLKSQIETRVLTVRFELEEKPLLQSGSQFHRSSMSLHHESLSILHWKCANCTMENSSSQQAQCRYCGFAP